MKNWVRACAHALAHAGKAKNYFLKNQKDSKMLSMRDFLSTSEQETLKTQHRKERDKRICDRIKAVLLYDKGWSYQEIADVLLLSDEAVRHHIQDYQATHKL